MEIDILDPRLYDDPWDTYRWLRDESRCTGTRATSCGSCRHEDVSHQPQPERYCAPRASDCASPPMSIIGMDDPEHTRQRRLINKGFTPRTVRQLSDMRELTNQIIDQIAERGSTTSSRTSPSTCR